MTPNPQKSASIFGSWCHSPTPSVFLYCLIIHYSLFSQIMLKLTYSNWFTCHPLNFPCTFLPATFYSHCSSHLENPLLSNQVHPSFICSSHPNSSVSFLIHPRLGWALLYFVAFVVAGVTNGWSADVFCLASQCLERKKKNKRNLNVFGWGKCSPVCQIPTLSMFLHPVFWFTSGLWGLQTLHVQLTGQSRGPLPHFFYCHLTYLFNIITSKLLVFKDFSDTLDLFLFLYHLC